MARTFQSEMKHSENMIFYYNWRSSFFPSFQSNKKVWRSRRQKSQILVWTLKSNATVVSLVHSQSHEMLWFVLVRNVRHLFCVLPKAPISEACFDSIGTAKAWNQLPRLLAGSHCDRPWGAGYKNIGRWIPSIWKAKDDNLDQFLIQLYWMAVREHKSTQQQEFLDARIVTFVVCEHFPQWFPHKCTAS